MNRNNYNVLGVMSGTSLDGVDIAWLNFRRTEQWSYEIRHAQTVPYPEKWKRILSEAVHFSDEKLQDCNEEYTRYLAGIVKQYIIYHSTARFDAVCSHGHTVRHLPDQGLTLQIGNLPQLAKYLRQLVVCDFRKQDVELGGQGAPLVPIGDELLFQDFQYCLNLGGFANISTRMDGVRKAYDICAVNTVLNFLAAKLNLPYDSEGKIAASGTLDENLLGSLGELAFYAQKPPKSLGVEWVNSQILPLLKDLGSVADTMRTYTTHVAIEIAKELDGSSASKVLVSGGGAYNTFLLEEIQKRTRVKVVIPSDELIQFKEALIFGFLGVLKLRGEVNVLASVTGAREDHVSGVVFTP